MTKPDDEAVRRLQRSLTRIAGAEADRLIADAVADVRTRAAGVIHGMLLQSLLERVEALSPAEPLGSPAPATTSVELMDVSATLSPSPRKDEGELVYLYGLTASALMLPSGLRGVGGRPPATLPVGDVFALIGTVPTSEFLPERFEEHLQDADWLERAARAHDAVLRQAGRSATVLPMRFGVIYSSHEVLRQTLLANETRIAEALATFLDLEEWSVTAEADAGEAPLSPSAERMGEGNGTAGAGSRYLRTRMSAARVQEEGEAARDRCAAACHERLGAMAEDAVLARLPRRPARGEAGPPREVILRAAYLVRRSRAESFVSASEALEHAFAWLGLNVAVEGPFPPFHFVPRDLLDAPA
jgi:hypothetical protein